MRNILEHQNRDTIWCLLCFFLCIFEMSVYKLHRLSIKTRKEKKIMQEEFYQEIREQNK